MQLLMENWRGFLIQEEELLEEGVAAWAARLGLFTLAMGGGVSVANAAGNDLVIQYPTQVDERGGDAGGDSEALPAHQVHNLMQIIGTATFNALKDSGYRTLDATETATLSREALGGHATPEETREFIQGMSKVQNLGHYAELIDANILETTFTREAEGIWLSMKVVGRDSRTLDRASQFIPNGAIESLEAIEQVVDAATDDLPTPQAPSTTTTPSPPVPPATGLATTVDWKQTGGARVKGKDKPGWLQRLNPTR